VVKGECNTQGPKIAQGCTKGSEKAQRACVGGGKSPPAKWETRQSAPSLADRITLGAHGIGAPRRPGRARWLRSPSHPAERLRANPAYARETDVNPVWGAHLAGPGSPLDSGQRELLCCSAAAPGPYARPADASLTKERNHEQRDVRPVA